MDQTTGGSPFEPRERELVEAAPVAHLATVRPDGRPHVVPVTFALITPTRLVTAVDHKPKRSADLQRLRNVDAHPDVALLVDHYDADWTKLWWLRVDGTAGVVREEPERSAHAEVIARKYPQYTSRPPAGPVIVVDVVSVTSWNVPASR